MRCTPSVCKRLSAFFKPFNFQKGMSAVVVSSFLIRLLASMTILLYAVTPQCLVTSLCMNSGRPRDYILCFVIYNLAKASNF